MSRRLVVSYSSSEHPRIRVDWGCQESSEDYEKRTALLSETSVWTRPTPKRVHAYLQTRVRLLKKRESAQNFLPNCRRRPPDSVRRGREMSSLFNKALSVFLPRGYQASSSPAAPASAAATASERKEVSSPAPVRVPVETPHRRRAQGAPQTTLRSAFELDVTMIHGQLMCMGMPRNLPTDKRGNRNNIDEIVSFLEHRFRDHYLIFNLTDKQYDYYKFKYQVLDKLVGARSKENDAVRSPTLQELFNICYAMEFWRSLHPENVAVLHCKNGKSCTRLVVAASLMFDGTCTNPEEALVLFYRKRLRRPLFGVDDLPRLIASAHDVLDAFGRLCISKSGVPPNAKPLMLNNLVMMGFPTDFEDQPAPVIELWKGNRQLFTSQGAGEADGYNRNARLVQWDAGGGVLVLQLACEVEGDILLVCRAIVDVGTAREPRDEERIVFQYSFHTGFLAPGATRWQETKSTSRLGRVRLEMSSCSIYLLCHSNHLLLP